jgi:hypothetical protein
MKKIISFSLWGDNPKYTIGAIKNAELAVNIYSDWICRYYVGTSVPEDIINQLNSYKNVEIVNMDEYGDWNSMFWRFYPVDDPDVKIMISRDADSRLSIREKLCVDEFIKSDKLFHSIIDHPFHNGIMGGMWGVKNNFITNMKSMTNSWYKTNRWQTDQSFLNTIIMPIINNSYLLHDSINLKNIPHKREDYKYIGESLDSNDVRSEHWCVFTFPEYFHCV